MPGRPDDSMPQWVLDLPGPPDPPPAEPCPKCGHLTMPFTKCSYHYDCYCRHCKFTWCAEGVRELTVA